MTDHLQPAGVDCAPLGFVGSVARAELFLPIGPAHSDPSVAVHEAYEDALLAIADRFGDPVAPGVKAKIKIICR
jgi:hypothetical protein